MGGWGTHLPSFRPNLRRTRFIVKITAESNPETLPWDTQKDRIEPNSVITDRVFNVLRRAGSDYTKVTYENFPTPYTSPYNTDLSSKNNQEVWEDVEELDYSDRQQFITDHKPDSELPKTEQIEALVEYHKNELDIFAPHIVADPFVWVYRAAFDPANDSDEEYTPNDDSAWVVPDAAERFPEQELQMCLEAVKDTAERHARKEITFDFGDTDPWWQGYYERILRANDSPVDTLNATEDIEGLQRRIQIKGEEQDLPEPILTDPQLHAPSLDRVFSSDSDRSERLARTQSELGESGDDETDDDDSGEEDITSTETDIAHNPVATDLEPDNDDDDNDTEGGDNEEDGPDFGTITGRQSVQRTLSETQSIILRVSQSTYETICRDVGIDHEEAEATRVGQAVLNQDLDIRSYINSGDDEV